MELKPVQPPPVEKTPETPEPPKTPKGFPWKKFFLILLALVVLLGGTGFVLAWRTDLLDPWLSPNIKELFGRPEQSEEEEKETEQPGDEPEEESKEDSEEPEETGLELNTADWKTYTNAKYRYSIKYSPDFAPVEAKGSEDQIWFTRVTPNGGGDVSGLVVINVSEGVSDPLIDRELTYLGRATEVLNDIPFNIGGEVGEQVVFYQSDLRRYVTETAVGFKGKTYRFSRGFIEHHTEYDLMLLTFEFLD